MPAGWKELRGGDGSYQAVAVHGDLSQPTAPVAEIHAPLPSLTRALAFVLGVLVGASLVAAGLALGAGLLQHITH